MTMRGDLTEMVEHLNRDTEITEFLDLMYDSMFGVTDRLTILSGMKTDSRLKIIINEINRLVESRNFLEKLALDHFNNWDFAARISIEMSRSVTSWTRSGGVSEINNCGGQETVNDTERIHLLASDQKDESVVQLDFADSYCEPTVVGQASWDSGDALENVELMAILGSNNDFRAIRIINIHRIINKQAQVPTLPSTPDEGNQFDRNEQISNTNMYATFRAFLSPEIRKYLQGAEGGTWSFIPEPDECHYYNLEPNLDALLSAPSGKDADTTQGDLLLDCLELAVRGRLYQEVMAIVLVLQGYRCEHFHEYTWTIALRIRKVCPDVSIPPQILVSAITSFKDRNMLQEAQIHLADLFRRVDMSRKRSLIIHCHQIRAQLRMIMGLWKEALYDFTTAIQIRRSSMLRIPNQLPIPDCVDGLTEILENMNSKDYSQIRNEVKLEADSPLSEACILNKIALEQTKPNDHLYHTRVAKRAELLFFLSLETAVNSRKQIIGQILTCVVQSLPVTQHFPDREHAAHSYASLLFTASLCLRELGDHKDARTASDVAKAIYTTARLAERSRMYTSGHVATEDTEKPPTEDTERPPTEDTERPPTEETERPLTEDTVRPPTEDTERPPTEDTERPPTEDTERPPTEDTEKPPTEDTERPPTEDTEKPPFNDRLFGAQIASAITAVKRILVDRFSRNIITEETKQIPTSSTEEPESNPHARPSATTTVRDSNSRVPPLVEIMYHERVRVVVNKRGRESNIPISRQIAKTPIFQPNTTTDHEAMTAIEPLVSVADLDATTWIDSSTNQPVSEAIRENYLSASMSSTAMSSSSSVETDHGNPQSVWCDAINNCNPPYQTLHSPLPSSVPSQEEDDDSSMEPLTDDDSPTEVTSNEVSTIDALKSSYNWSKVEIYGTRLHEDWFYEAIVCKYDANVNQWRYSRTLVHVIYILHIKQKSTFRDVLSLRYLHQSDPSVTYVGKYFRKEKPVADTENPASDYLKDVVAHQISRYYVDIFNSELEHKHGIVTHRVQMVPVVHMQIMNDQGDVIQYLNMEPYVAGKFEKITNNNLYVNNKIDTGLLLAFTHYTWCRSKEKLMITDLQGWPKARNDRVATILTDPMINSPELRKVLVSGNMGLQGFYNFWTVQHEKCDAICEMLRLYRDEIPTKEDGKPDYEAYCLSKIER